MKAKKLIAIALCIVMCVVLCPAVYAARTTQITLSNEAAFPDEEVTLDVSIPINPGIMSMTFSIKYDKDNFEFVTCNKGFISTPTYKNHSDKGYVAFSVSETLDKTNSGLILSATFKIKKGAKPGAYPFTLSNPDPIKYGNNLENCFANSLEEKIDVVIKAGSVRIKGECDISGHKFGDWTETVAANCTTLGKKERICSVCQTKEEKNIPLTHDFETEWTVDKAATPEEYGIMSRHCKLCDVTTDELTFTYEEITGGNDEENTSSNVSSSDNTSSNIADVSPSDTSSVADTTSGTASSDNTTSEDSLTSNTVSSNVSTSSESTSSQSKPNEKPNINNVVGEKIPQTEAEKLDNYDVVFPPVVEEEPTESTDSTTSTTDSPSANAENNTPAESTNTTEEKPFIATTAGIITIIICAVLSVGILAVAALLILKKRKKD